MGTALLHMTSPAAWLAAVQGSTFPSQDGSDLADPAPGAFLHLSTVDQVVVPANAVPSGPTGPSGPTDRWLLVVDPDRLGPELRWEAGDPPHPDGWQFPHLYAPLPTAAVVAVVAYEPGPDGRYRRPVVPAVGDHVARAHAFTGYLARSRSTSVVGVGDGFAVRHAAFPASYDHHKLVLPALPGPAEAASWCAEALAGLDHWQLVLTAAIDRPTSEAYAGQGWTVAEQLLMLADRAPQHAPDPAAARLVEDVQLADLAAWRAAGWRQDLPTTVTDDAIAQLVGREALTDAVARVVHLAVRGPDGRPVARADLRVVGATAQIEDVATRPDHRGRGLASALVLAAVRRARELGCDHVSLEADADDWPWRLYQRLGFQTIGASAVLDRDLLHPTSP